jgi:hypothetical protein
MDESGKLTPKRVAATFQNDDTSDFLQNTSTKNKNPTGVCEQECV